MTRPGLDAANFTHLMRLTDGTGLFEHALLAEPRPEHGYCVDDVARALVVTCREPAGHPDQPALVAHYLRFVTSCVAADGRCHNRMDTTGAWTDEPGVGDWWGRALWGLGVAARCAPIRSMRSQALLAFRGVSRARSPHRRSMAFAALGAGELLLCRPEESAAQLLLEDAVTALERDDAPGWAWPEPRLGYGNGSVVEALVLAGQVLCDAPLLARGLVLLDFLLDQEITGGRLSVTPVGGRGPAETAPGFDQQPIEVAALADACARAYDATGDTRWLEGVALARGWFLGDNDALTPMVDLASGGGYDGLERVGRNANMGAESTLAALSTLQQARRLSVAG